MKEEMTSPRLTSVTTEYFLINDCCDWKTVEAVGKGFP